MKICVAQIAPYKGEIKRNLEVHEGWIVQAIAQQADAIFFSELSLTGYEPTLAQALQMEIADPRLDSLQFLSNQGDITIGVGAPIRQEGGIYIGMIVFQPYQPRQLYAKQILHEDEDPYFIPGNQQILIKLDTQKIAPAICYESLQPTHLQQAMEMGAHMYLASVAKPQRGIDKAFAYFPQVAKEKSIPILMANCVGYCDNFQSVGQSAVWDHSGNLVGQLPDHEAGMLIYDSRKQALQILSLPIHP